MPLAVASTVPPEPSSMNSNLSFSSNCSTARRSAAARLLAVASVSPAVPVACRRPMMVVKRLMSALSVLP